MKRRWEQETPINDENLEEIKENILSRIQFFHSQGFIDKPVSIEDEKQKMNAFSKEELAELCSQIEAMDNEICLRFLDKFLQQKETFRQLRNKLMVQGPKLRTITDLCWNLKVDYFDLKKDIAKRKESEALESVEGEKKEGESEHSEESASEEYESVTQMQYRKSIQFLKSLIQANEKKFTEMNRLNRDLEKELKSTLLYCQNLDMELAQHRFFLVNSALTSKAKLEIEQLKSGQKTT